MMRQVRAALLSPLLIVERGISVLLRLSLAILSPREAARLLLSLDRRLYDLQGRAAVAYGKGVHTKHRHTRYHDFFVERIGAGERVLDVGCGIGALAADVAERSGAEVLAVDINSRAIALARERFSHSRVRYEERDATKSLPEEGFDTVILSNVLEHIADRVAFLWALQRSAQNRRFLIRVPSYERDWRVPLKEELGIDYRLDPTHHIEYTLESFCAELAAANLRASHIESRWGEIWAEVVNPSHSVLTASGR